MSNLSTIIDTQDEFLAIIQTLIDNVDIPADFTKQDNNLDKGVLPLIILDIKTSDPGEYGNLSSGQTALTDHTLELIVVIPISDHSNNMRTARKFAIDNFDIILKNIPVNCGTVFHQPGFYNEKKCVRVKAAIAALDNG